MTELSSCDFQQVYIFKLYIFFGHFPFCQVFVSLLTLNYVDSVNRVLRIACKVEGTLLRFGDHFFSLYRMLGFCSFPFPFLTKTEAWG